MTYGIDDFKNLQFNPLCKKSVLTEYRTLSEIINGFENNPALDSILRYTILLCEPKSSLVISERDINYRKEIAAELSGIPDKLREDVYTYSNVMSLELAVRYLTRFSKSKEYSAILVFENCYQENIRLLLKPIDDTTENVKDKDVLDAVQKKSLIKNEIVEDLKRIESLYVSFFFLQT